MSDIFIKAIANFLSGAGIGAVVTFFYFRQKINIKFSIKKKIAFYNLLQKLNYITVKFSYDFNNLLSDLESSYDLISFKAYSEKDVLSNIKNKEKACIDCIIKFNDDINETKRHLTITYECNSYDLKNIEENFKLVCYLWSVIIQHYKALKNLPDNLKENDIKPIIASFENELIKKNIKYN